MQVRSFAGHFFRVRRYVVTFIPKCCYIFTNVQKLWAHLSFSEIFRTIYINTCCQAISIFCSNKSELFMEYLSVRGGEFDVTAFGIAQEETFIRLYGTGDIRLFLS